MENFKLTKSLVDALKPQTEPAKDYIAWCGELRGFGCRVRRTGAKSFVAMYRVKGAGRSGKPRMVTICKVGELTPDQARKRAKETLARAALGEDEAVEKARKRAELTVTQLCDEYLAEGCDAKKASTVATDRGRIARHIKPLMGKMRIGQVRRGDIERFMRDVATGKTAVVENGRAVVTGGKGTAARTVRLLGGIFSYAVARGYIETNPRFGVKVYADGKGERFLTKEEMQRLGETLREAEFVGLPWNLNEEKDAKHLPTKDEDRREIVSPYAVAGIRLLMLTGCRVGEILGLRWSDVDFERGVFNLADSKTGAKKVLLGASALEVLAELPRTGEYVIAGALPNKPRSDLKRPWERIKRHAGLESLRLHDLRHSFASVGAGAGMGLAIVGKLLGHESPSTTARYAHLADDPLRRASESISGMIATAMSGSDQGAATPIKKLGD
ncbi:site-specific integrase [Hoeflea alexandrii]|uniref:Tyrosine-type recombinase/integrase n=1 Tax=Hoeflea alexandrii TaxID=288436 RepID=A0ABT1CTG6_9HYPH|nr:site-specific integrase [Hoeflea alexandrii]MCO6409479.1 tyrosine-type recombinase/integrase [Hoeflea alexandrii]MCY0152509.1 site-specific integrase [Hoeflea alexandrii]